MTILGSNLLMRSGIGQPGKRCHAAGLFLPILDLNAATYLIRLELFVLSVCNASLK